MKVILMMALSADGISARNSYQLVDWTCPADKKLFVELTRSAGVVIMGSRTFDTIGKPLPGRLNIVYTRNKNRVSESEDLQFTDMDPALLLESLGKKNFSEVVLIGGASVNTLFYEKNLIDEIYITYSPHIFGVGLPLFSNLAPVEGRLKLKEVFTLGEDSFCARYGVKGDLKTL